VRLIATLRADVFAQCKLPQLSSQSSASRRADVGDKFPIAGVAPASLSSENRLRWRAASDEKCSDWNLIPQLAGGARAASKDAASDAMAPARRSAAARVCFAIHRTPAARVAIGCGGTSQADSRPVRLASAAIAELAARRSHNPKVASSIFTRRIFQATAPKRAVATCRLLRKWRCASQRPAQGRRAAAAEASGVRRPPREARAKFAHSIHLAPLESNGCSARWHRFQCRLVAFSGQFCGAIAPLELRLARRRAGERQRDNFCALSEAAAARFDSSTERRNNA
jgi:hypothetical protein